MPARSGRPTVSVRATARALLGSPQFRRAPFRTLVRGVIWTLRCVLHRPAVISLDRWGCRLYLPAEMRRGATAIYLFRDKYEPELGHLEELLHPGATFIDAGASIGLYTVVAATLVGEGGTVLAFEPADLSFPVLRRNIELNGLENVVAFKQALSDTVGTANLYHVSGAPNFSLGRPPGAAVPSEEVQTTTIDEVARGRALEGLSCIKLDVEGGEALVLRGAEETLRRWRPAVILELDEPAARRLGGPVHASVDTLRSLGYRFELAQPEGLVPMTEVPTLRNVIARPG